MEVRPRNGSVVVTPVHWSYAWSRDEYNADLFTSSVRRYDPAPVFSSREDRQTYLLDYYRDASYTGLTGGLNTLVVGLGYRS